MWQRFTERARRVILYAQEEAIKMQTNDVDVEHYLLGLTLEEEGAGGRILKQQGITYAVVQVKLEEVLREEERVKQVEPKRMTSHIWGYRPKKSVQAEPSREPKLTPQAKRALEFSADEARRLHHNYIGSEHLLLALLRMKEGRAFPILRECGLRLEDMRSQVSEGFNEDTVYRPSHSTLSSKLSLKIQEMIISQGFDVNLCIEQLRLMLLQDTPPNDLLEELAFVTLETVYEVEIQKGDIKRADDLMKSITHLRELKSQRDDRLKHGEQTGP